MSLKPLPFVLVMLCVLISMPVLATLLALTWLDPASVGVTVPAARWAVLVGLWAATGLVGLVGIISFGVAVGRRTARSGSAVALSPMRTEHGTVGLERAA